MLNFFNFKFWNNSVLVTNDFGEYDFLTKEEFRKLISEEYSQDSELYVRLKSKRFIYDSSNMAFAKDCLHKYIDSKNYLFFCTSLHIFVLTNACNQRCKYCQAQYYDNNTNGFMSKEIAQKAVDIAIQSPSLVLNFEFQGGEPLLNFDVLKYIVNYSKSRKGNKIINYSVVSNLTLLTQDIIDFFIQNNISVSTSMDGNEHLHNLNRPYLSGKGTFLDVKKSIVSLNKNGINVGALETTTKQSLSYPKEIVDSYVDMNMKTISIRPLTPLGCANAKWNEIGYTSEEFVDFYKKCFYYLIEVNKNGYYISENISSIFLKKIFTGISENYMELRSPCGAAVGQLAYYYDGNIYTCDEGRMLSEMGDDSFLIGNVLDSNYDDMMNSSVCKTVCSSSILESLPLCSDCVYQPYCGTCPVVTYALNKDIYEKNPWSYRCKINQGILDIIFECLRRNDPEELRILRSWIE